MSISLGIIHLGTGPLELSGPQQAQLSSISDDLLLAVAIPAEHLYLAAFTLVSPLFQGGGTVAALHALLLAARHDILVALRSPLEGDLLTLANDLALDEGICDLLLHASASGTPPLPSRLHQACLRPLERALLEDPTAQDYPRGLRTKKR